MKRHMKIITVETVILWLESALTLDSDSWIPFWVFIATTLYLALVAYVNLDRKGEKKNEQIKEN